MAEKDYSYFNESDTMEGFEDISSRTVAIPFLKILQPLSPQLDKNKPDFIKGAEAGQFFNSVTKKIYPEEIGIIVLAFAHRYIEWLPERGGFVANHSPEEAMQLTVSTEFGKWQTSMGNDLQENYVYICLIEDEENEGPVCLSLASSAIKAARMLNRLISTHIMPDGEKAKPYYLIMDLTAEYKTNDKGSWYTPEVSFSDYVNAEQYAIVAPERKALPDKTIDYALLESKQESTEIQGKPEDSVPY